MGFLLAAAAALGLTSIQAEGFDLEAVVGKLLGWALTFLVVWALIIIALTYLGFWRAAADFFGSIFGAIGAMFRAMFDGVLGVLGKVL